MAQHPSTRKILAVAASAAVLAALIQIFDGGRRAHDDTAVAERPVAAADAAGDADAATLAVASGPRADAGDAGDAGDAADAGETNEPLDPLTEAELDPRCAVVTRANDERLRRVAEGDASCATIALAAQHAWHACDADDTGAAWSLALTSASCAKGPAVRVTFAIARIERGGVAVASPSFADALASDPEAPRDGGPASLDLGIEGAGVEIALDASLDVDGDGAREAVLTLTRRTAGAALSSASVWTFHRGAIEPYGERRLPAIVAFDDVDVDGRPDIVTRTPYDAPLGAWLAKELSADGALAGAALAPPLFVAHALDDGGFTDHDAIARSYVKRACRARPRPLARDAGAPSTDAVARHVICARVWGATEVEAVAIAKAACPPADAGADPKSRDKDPCARDLEALARVRPPVHLP